MSIEAIEIMIEHSYFAARWRFTMGEPALRTPMGNVLIQPERASAAQRGRKPAVLVS